MAPTIATRWHLKHDGRPMPKTEPPLAGLVVVEVLRCPAAFYRFLYTEVGRQWNWTDRLRWNDAQIDELFARADVHLFVLYQDGAPGGFYEVAGTSDGMIDITYFGLMPWLTGKGVGKWMLAAAIRSATALGGGGVILNTCSLDHPAALANYQARGFVIERDEQYEVITPAQP